MRNVLALLFFFFVLISCEEPKNKEAEIAPVVQIIDSNAPKELSVADVEAMMQSSAGTPTYQYNGAVGYGNVKEYIFTCDSSKRIQIELISEYENLNLEVQKEMWTSARLDAEKVAKVKSFVHISDSLTFSEVCKKTIRFKALLKLNPVDSDSSDVAKFQLNTYIQ